MYHRIHQLNRRTVLRASAGLFTAGIGLAAYSQRATAQVTLGSLNMPSETTLEDEDGEIYEVFVRIDGAWEYDINDTPDTWEVLLVLVDPADGTRAVLDEASGTLSKQADQGTYSVVGRVTDAPFYETADFTVADPGASKDVPLSVLVLFYVRNGSTILAKDKVGAEPTVRVHHAKEPALVGGEGAIAAQHDATGTPPFTDG